MLQPEHFTHTFVSAGDSQLREITVAYAQSASGDLAFAESVLASPPLPQSALRVNRDLFTAFAGEQTLDKKTVGRSWNMLARSGMAVPYGGCLALRSMVSLFDAGGEPLPPDNPGMKAFDPQGLAQYVEFVDAMLGKYRWRSPQLYAVTPRETGPTMLDLWRAVSQRALVQ